VNDTMISISIYGLSSGIYPKRNFPNFSNFYQGHKESWI